MSKAITFPVERAEEALTAVQALVELSHQQFEMCSKALEELEFTGEMQKDFMKRLVHSQSEIRKARSTLKDLTSTTPQPRRKGATGEDLLALGSSGS